MNGLNQDPSGRISEQMACAKRLGEAMHVTDELEGDIGGIPALVEALPPDPETYKAMYQLSIDASNVASIAFGTGVIEQCEYFCDDSLNVQAVRLTEPGGNTTVQLKHELGDPAEVAEGVVFAVKAILDQNNL